MMTPSVRYRTMLILYLGFSCLILNAQDERKVIRQGIREYSQGDYSEAEVQFRRAGDINHESFEAGFNTGAAMYNQEKYRETAEHYASLVDRADDPVSMAHVWHNLGNSLLEQGQYAQSIEAYKNSLRHNPSDMDTKYNLAYARKKLQEQDQQQQQQNQQQQQDQQEKDQQQDQQEQDQQQQEQQQQEQQQPRPLEISKEDAGRMLEAIQQQEKDVKEKVDEKKAAVAKVKTEKDW